MLIDPATAIAMEGEPVFSMLRCIGVRECENEQRQSRLAKPSFFRPDRTGQGSVAADTCLDTQ